ncbi:MAG: helix-turn-helix transcriptional regulator [Chloroflexota bacterium]
MNESNLAKNIKQAIQDSGMTITVIADRLGKSREWVYSIQRGKSNPTVDSLIDLSHVLRVPLSVFFEGIGYAPEIKSLEQRVADLERNLTLLEGTVHVMQKGGVYR